MRCLQTFTSKCLCYLIKKAFETHINKSLEFFTLIKLPPLFPCKTNLSLKGLRTFISKIGCFSRKKKHENGYICKTREISNLWKRGKIVILVKTRNFYRSRMMKRISPLESSREI